MIRDLADYSALKKLASALWGEEKNYHGAAVMIGAGFSRSAARTADSKKRLPLWPDMCKILAHDLNTTHTSDPLRLAEEYCAYFGKQALNDLIKKSINDTAWQPGYMYKMLLELPWSEVLTTNWDTLLERTVASVPQITYSIVSHAQNLASTKSPRITKLHGTINVSEELIFTQEEYRQYPIKHAAFVNFTRQVFIENELCLLGFSGDDPNFLQWAGWVRDNLTTHARRIYLVGALDLTTAKRKYLESINITAIDLSDLVREFDSDTRHEKATELFLQELGKLKPKPAWDWTPTRMVRTQMSTEEHNKTFKDHEYAAKLLEQQLPTLIADREGYPGWLVCPLKIRWQLVSQISDPYPNQKNLKFLSPENRAKILYEIAWRYDITNELPEPWLMEEFLNICDPATPCSLSKQQQLEIGLLVLKSTRWTDYDDREAEETAKRISEIIKSNASHWPEATNELLYHQALIARDSFDYMSLEKIADDLTCDSSIWKIRKASILAELNNYEAADPLVAEAYQELLMAHRNDKHSIYIFSRLAWAHWLLRGIQFSTLKGTWEPFPSIYRQALCDPEAYIEGIQSRISENLEKQEKKKNIEPSFEPGSYRDPSKTITLGGPSHPILLLDGLYRNVGMPLRWESVSFSVDHADKLVKLNDLDDIHRIPLAIRAASSEDAESIKSTLSRIQIACLDENFALYLQKHCIEAIEYWSEKRTTGTQQQKKHALNRLRVFIEVLARILVRATPTQAKEAFSLAIKLGNSPAMQHHWLLPALNHLIRYALKSIPESDQHELLLDTLSFPLGTEIGISDPLERWPNPVIEIPGERNSDRALDLRIEEIIDLISNDTKINRFALLRLLPLIDKKFLSSEENQKIAQKIWGAFKNDTLPNTGLLIHTLLELPSLDPDATNRIVRNRLFDIQGASLINREILMAMVGACYLTEGVRPNESQAIEYFNRLIIWRPEKDGRSSFELAFTKEDEEATAHWIGRALSESVIPSLSSAHLTRENFDKLIEFHNETTSSPVLSGYAYFGTMNVEMAEDALNIIRKNLQAQEPKAVSYAAMAILKWVELTNTRAIPSLISRLIYLIESGRIISLQMLLDVVKKLLVKGLLTPEEIEVLTDSVPAIFDSASYEHIDPASGEAVSASIIREACVKLALAILNVQESSELQRITEKAQEDPLPEVRFAHITHLPS
ncbi:SIR2 family protein [Castellaniella ginsengisoli]|uniref:SIR2 family protein n=1 Tax=Castellaniella ginsengisoli TaxID=546114 RepID=A0AB39ET53_9BURK